MSVTFFYDQFNVDLMVIKPPRNLNPAAIYPSIFRLSIEDGQRQISICHLAQQLVPGGPSVRHSLTGGGKDGVGTFGRGHPVFSPTKTQDSMGFGVIPTCQRDIVPNEANDSVAEGHCEGAAIDDTDYICNPDLKPTTAPTHTPTPTSTLHIV